MFKHFNKLTISILPKEGLHWTRINFGGQRFVVKTTIMYLFVTPVAKYASSWLAFMAWSDLEYYWSVKPLHWPVLCQLPKQHAPGRMLEVFKALLIYLHWSSKNIIWCLEIFIRRIELKAWTGILTEFFLYWLTLMTMTC